MPYSCKLNCYVDTTLFNSAAAAVAITAAATDADVPAERITEVTDTDIDTVHCCW